MMAAKTPPAIPRRRPPVWLTMLIWAAVHSLSMQGAVLAAVPAGGSCIGARTLHDGDIGLKPGGSIAFMVDVADTMCDPRLEVYVTGRKDARTEFDLSLVCVSEDSAGSADGDVPGYDSLACYRTGSVLDHAFLAPGRYEVRLENASRYIGPQTLRGLIKLTWIRDAGRLAANRMKRRVRFSGDPENSAESYTLRSPSGPLHLELVSDPEWRLLAPARGKQGGPPRSISIDSDYVADVGVLDYDRDGHEELLIVAASGGSSGVATALYLFLPKHGELVRSGDRWRSTSDPRAVAFLDSLSRTYQDSEHDWARAGDDDPRFAFDDWSAVNGDIRNGKMQLRRYFGLPFGWHGRSVIRSRGPLVFASIFRAGVVAYDTSRDEHFVVFNPSDQYAWASRMEVMGDYVIIYPGARTLVVVDLRTLHLHRLDHDEIGARPDGRLEVVRGRLLVRGVDIDRFAAPIPARGRSD